MRVPRVLLTLGLVAALYLVYAHVGTARARAAERHAEQTLLADIDAPYSAELTGSSKGALHGNETLALNTSAAILLPPNEDLLASTVKEGKAKYTHLSRIVVVAARAAEDTRWAATELPAGWQHAVYVVDDPTAPLHTPQNKGREAGVYLWYILEHYDQLPDTMVFLHAHRAGFPEAWHTDNEVHSNPLAVQRLRIDSVQRRGYVNLRCLLNPGCPDDLQLFRDPPNPELEHELAMPAALAAMFGWTNRATLPPVIAAPCCSQFAVAKWQVLARPRADYERFYRWLVDTPLPDAVSGRVFEYLWHIIFGRDPVYCPEAWQCYCETYGIWCLDGLDD